MRGGPPPRTFVEQLEVVRCKKRFKVEVVISNDSTSEGARRRPFQRQHSLGVIATHPAGDHNVAPPFFSLGIRTLAFIRHSAPF
mmetsp:Transcript_6747/g.20941  ORF Transcript_6747/g.20941 Transcript_6747/m.20941 type:complete len:84 (-) Transcript_6747:7-258(-)|eukprot:scaffold197937_cov37-Tisochrysis_lutea.AAC.1